MCYRHCRAIAFFWLTATACAFLASAQDLEKLTEEQKRDFLLNGKVVNYRQIGKGITNPYRLTLSQGSMVHDAAFQSVDEYRPQKRFDDGSVEMNFRDSYKYNIAAFELAKLLGLEDMMPVTVERKWKGMTGSLSWWLPVWMDERQRMEKQIFSPDPEAWNRQMYRIRVFSQLVFDKDRNLQNVLISEDWHLWMIDFTRAFRLYHTLENPKNLVMCDRRLLQKLRQLDAAELKKKTKHWLNEPEIKGIMARRDKIVALFEDLISKKGEQEVLYD